MNKKIILCALLVFFSGADLTFGKVKKRNHVKKIQPQEEVCDEIDNFDFLYVNGGENGQSWPSDRYGREIRSQVYRHHGAGGRQRVLRKMR